MLAVANAAWVIMKKEPPYVGCYKLIMAFP
jgi:hypothetical protein